MHTTTTDPRRLLRMKEAAKYAAVSRSTLYNEIKAGRLVKLKFGSSSLIEIRALDKWIDENVKAT